ncbi:general substrate transporter [Clavulina sp. PMI_390]|nr:general substrate transporter [Clavulina sp. PMI_390]
MTEVISEGALGMEPLLYKGKWWHNRGIRNLNLMLLLPLFSSFSNGFDGSMMNGLQSVTNWQNFFNHPAGGRLGLFNAIQNIGGICGFPMAPYAADYFGRKPTIIFGSFVVCIGVALQTAAQSFSFFIGARWLIGFGGAFTQLASPLLVTESAYPSQRAAFSSLYNSMWFSGAIVAAWGTFGTFHLQNTWSWRIPSLLQGIVSVLQVFTLWFIPESPRYQVRNGQDEKALEMLAKYHANGDRDDPLVEFEYNEIKEAIRMEEEAKHSSSYLELFSTPGNLRRMRIIIGIAFFSQWSGNGLISYYFNLILNGIGITTTFDQTLINGILQIWNFSIAITSSLVTERFGRRTMFIVSTAGMTVFYMFITVCGGVYQNSLKHDADGNLTASNTQAAHTFIAMVFLFNAFYAIAYTPLIVSFSIEILPYRIRAKGMAVFNLSVTAALIFNQYANPIAWAHLNYKYYIVYTVWNFFETIYIYLFAVETKGRTLEETALLFDNPDTATNLAARANVHGGHLAQAEAEELEKEKPSHSSQENISDEK